ncbi:MAG TPA: ethanolamine ammonia lyase large subunit, partial [Clostridiaceae bacterium]|nr:ethanolamine ammonia lyase large subunit [Clostridiaceae bacterium]
DAVIGLNPVEDTVDNVSKILKKFYEIKAKWEVPTQACVLAHVTTQMEAIKKGAPSDLIFQSVAGTQKGNEAFGITADMLSEAKEIVTRQG